MSEEHLPMKDNEEDESIEDIINIPPRRHPRPLVVMAS